jgi:hypothetical protein
MNTEAEPQSQCVLCHGTRAIVVRSDGAVVERVEEVERLEQSGGARRRLCPACQGSPMSEPEVQRTVAEVFRRTVENVMQQGSFLHRTISLLALNPLNDEIERAAIERDHAHLAADLTLLELLAREGERIGALAEGSLRWARGHPLRMITVEVAMQDVRALRAELVAAQASWRERFGKFICTRCGAASDRCALHNLCCAECSHFALQPEEA